MAAGDQDAVVPDFGTGSTQLNVLSSMNEHLASENAALIAELAKLQRKQRIQAIDEGRQKQSPNSVDEILTNQLVSLLSSPGTAAAAAVASSSSSQAADEEQRKGDSKAMTPSESWNGSHAILQQRAQHLQTRVELTHLRAEGEMLKAEAAEAAAQAQTKQGVVITLQRQLNAAHTEHQKEIKELKKAAKQIERRAEELAHQLPKSSDDSPLQVSRLASQPLPQSLSAFFMAVSM